MASKTLTRLTLAEFHAEAIRRFGSDWKEWRFVCPNCGCEQTANDLIDAGAGGGDLDAVGRLLAFSCVGRFTDEKGCDWTLGGLFRIHRLEVDGRPAFELAQIEAGGGEHGE